MAQDGLPVLWLLFVQFATSKLSAAESQSMEVGGRFGTVIFVNNSSALCVLFLRIIVIQNLSDPKFLRIIVNPKSLRRRVQLSCAGLPTPMDRCD